MVVTGAANAMTGGASAGPGETVVTGDSSASVQVTNVINADSEGGTSHTIIEKTVNGVREVIEETKEFAPGEPVEVNVSAEAHSGGSSTTQTSVEVGAEATLEGEVVTSLEMQGEASSTEEVAKEARGIGKIVLDAVSNFFASVWSFLSN